MQEAIDQFGGVVNKLDVADEGIKLVAIFGAPAAYEAHAARAAHAALEMRDRLDGVNQQIAALLRMADCGLQIDGPEQSAILKQRIGLNLGATFAGNVGSAVRKEYT